jgi:hypothetical protein
MARPWRRAYDRQTTRQGSLLPAAFTAFALTVAALTLLIGQSLRVDPQGWLDWGRQLVLHDGDFSTADYPSWKPLPVLLTAPLALSGTLAPTILLVILRAAGGASLVLVFLLGRRRAGSVAGAVAAGALALTPGWWSTLAGGGIEPTLVTLSALAVSRHEAGRHGQALALLCLVALGREEAVPLIVLYGADLARHDLRWPVAAVLAAAGVLVMWLAGDWLGSGDPLHGGALAHAAPDAVALRATGEPVLTALETVAGLLAPPLWVLAVLGTWVVVQVRDRTLGALLAAALLWVAVDLVLAARGYPLPSRFLFPPAAAFGLVAGLGGAMLVRQVASAAGSRSFPRPFRQRVMR